MDQDESTEPTVPLLAVPDSVANRLAEFGAPSTAAGTILYRALANHPEVLTGWIELAWRLRQMAVTPRRLRELMIVRGAQMMNCDYERLHHEAMARVAGVTDDELAALASWRKSQLFSEKERVALEFMEDMAAGSVSEAVTLRLKDHFNPKERVELTVTAGMYAMVPRVINALRLPLEERYVGMGDTSPSYVGPDVQR